ncbi:DNA/RNA non-specific endonuclease [Flavobacterium lindanitolerans]|uniref:DNA/RNA non-specific endonuclease n=1 Tax=Flavobacterium lindanitolerans TaxID=428988 RepID=UPI0031D1BCFC
MISEKLFQGYDEKFIPNQTVPLPKLSQEQSEDLVSDNEGSKIIKYINYSLQQSAFHKFPFYTATNIDGIQFKKVPRKDNWRKDTRISKEFQFGKELYSAPKSDFDKGHMTKREDVQWGETIGIALNAADSTFYYTNAVPQHKDLNRDIWRSLEDYILHTETKQNELRVCVFTGPVLSSSNPYFVTPIDGKQIQIPALFWKVVVFQKEDGKLYRVGFMMSQNKLLQENNIIEELESDDQLFMQFKDADTYQVNISLIEELTGLEISKAIDSYTDTRNTKLILKEIDIDPDLENDSLEYELGFVIDNIRL